MRIFSLALVGLTVLGWTGGGQSASPDPGKVELGKLLFFDPRLSGDAEISCSTCHDPKKGWTDGLPLSVGYPGSLYFRNTQTLLNAADNETFYWDGRLDGSDLATMVRDHISEAHFLNADGRLVIERMRQVPEYEEAFKKHFGGEPTYGRILDAVGAFVASIRSRNVPYDKFVAGDEGAISESARRGHALFNGKAGCVNCHDGPRLAGPYFMNIGVPENPEIFKDPLRHITFRRFFRTLGVPGVERLRHDPGRLCVTKEDEDDGAFRVPSLREVSRTAPYMHNGVFATLEEVVEFFDAGPGPLEPLNLTADEKRDLVEFLKTLSGDEIVVEPPKLPEYKLRKLGEN